MTLTIHCFRIYRRYFMFPQSKFSRTFLQLYYWLTWFGVGILWLLVQLPYPVLRFLSTRTDKPGALLPEATRVNRPEKYWALFPDTLPQRKRKTDRRVRKRFDMDRLDNLTRTQVQKSRRTDRWRIFYVTRVREQGDRFLSADDGHLSSA